MLQLTEVWQNYVKRTEKRTDMQKLDAPEIHSGMDIKKDRIKGAV